MPSDTPNKNNSSTNGTARSPRLARENPNTGPASTIIAVNPTAVVTTDVATNPAKVFR